MRTTGISARKGSATCLAADSGSQLGAIHPVAPTIRRNPTGAASTSATASPPSPGSCRSSRTGSQRPILAAAQTHRPPRNKPLSRHWALQSYEPGRSGLERGHPGRYSTRRFRGRTPPLFGGGWQNRLYGRNRPFDSPWGKTKSSRRDTDGCHDGCFGCTTKRPRDEVAQSIQSA